MSDDKKKPSRLDKHLGLLGIEDVPEDELKDERELVAQMNLPPLDLAGQKLDEQSTPTQAVWWKGRQWQTGLALVAVLTLVVLVGRMNSGDDPGIRYKGKGNISIWYQRGAQTEKLTEDDILRSGDVFRVEVLVAEPTTAYLIVTDNNTRRDQIGQSVIDQAQTIAGGETGSFDAAFELTEPNLNEQVNVVFCHASFIDGKSATRMREILWQIVQGDAVEACRLVTRRLR